ncbi:hypothetical protein GGI26_002135 [Coemansia sp. RSA 1358]|nr:hypothetical protein GGI26_002135 [Coemansia sp. RSA 1358]
MELPDLGNQCAFEDCKQFDFLPFTCKYCQKQFCTIHGNIVVHNCPCAPQGDNKSPAEFSTNSVPITYYTRPSRDSPERIHEEAKKKLSVEQVQALEQLKQIDRVEQIPAKRPKQSSHISPKIELMRLKAKASGNVSIDMQDRLYLCVKSPSKSIALFVNKKSIIGNTATQFARRLGMSILPDRVYRLYNPRTGDVLPSNKQFEDLLSFDSKDGIYNGCTLELRC